MRRPMHNTTKLPKALLDQIGEQDGKSGARSAKGKHNVPGARKERRKAARQQKKGQQKQNRFIDNRQNDQAQSDSEEEDGPQPDPPPPNKAKAGSGSSKPLKSILKRSEQGEKTSLARQHESSERAPPAVSQGVRDRLAADDAEIAALEKALGIKSKKKLPKSFEEDGLDALLDDLGDGGVEVSGKRKRTEGDEWLERKRRKAQGIQDDDRHGSAASDDEIDVDMDASDESRESDIGSSEGLEDEQLGSGEDDFSGFESGTPSSPPPHKRVRENPYVAPPSADVEASTKYVPPSLRGPASSDAEALSRLRRQTQGLLNRLSEANMLSILGDIEKLYRDHPRQHVTSALLDILFGLICDRTALQDTFIILHAGIIVAIYKVIGTDFGAQVIQRVVEDFARFDAPDSQGTGKETNNLVSLLAELYNFQMIGSALIFDYIRMFVGELSEANTELLLKIIRISGPQLRQEDPSSLKDIVLLLQPAIARTGEANLSVRTKFMIETINNLKNNRMKTGAVASAVTSEHTVRMKKILGSLNTRSIKSSEPLRVSLNDIRHADKRGKWWLVGASWKEPSNDLAETPTANNAPTDADTSPDLDPTSTDLLHLAREQRMNTDVRRAIFVTIMSASDYRDAHLRLLKLRLKKSQELEIPRVLIQCAGAEQVYNPFYTLIARRLCGERRLKMAFQFALWDLFRRMGESGGDDDGDGEGRGEEEGEGEGMSTRTMVNLAKMFGVLIAEGGLGVGVLKTLNLAYLQPKTQVFVEVLLITVILHGQRASDTKRDEKALMETFVKVRDTPQVARGLQYFLKKVVSKTDVAGGKAEKETVRWACRVAGDALAAIASATITDG